MKYFPKDLLRSPLVNISDDDISAIVREVALLGQIPSPTFHEGARSQYVRNRLEKMGVNNVQVIGNKNILARVGGAKSPVLLLAAHMDTVSSETHIEIREREGLLIGPGVADNTLSVVAGLHLIERFRKLGFDPPNGLIFAITTCEEGLGNLRGITEVMDYLGGEVDFVLTIEGLSLGMLSHQAIGVERWEVCFQGPGGHSWNDAGGPNPNHALIHLGSSLLSLQLQPRTTCNLSIIEGGESINSISTLSRVFLDIRSLSQREVGRISTFVQEEARKLGEQEKLDVTLTLLGKRPAVCIPRNNPLCQLGREIHKHLGIKSEYIPLSTDSNIPLSRGIPSVAIGMARGGNCHRADEFLEVSSIALGLKQLILFVLSILSLNAPSRSPKGGY